MPLAGLQPPSPLTRAIAAMPWGAENSTEPPVRVEFQGDRHYNVVIQLTPISAKDRTKAAKGLATILPDSAVEALLKQEGKLLAWLNKSRTNAAQMALDPITALHKAGIKLDAEAIQRLARHREAAKRTFNPDAGQWLGSLVVEAGPVKPILKKSAPKPKRKK